MLIYVSGPYTKNDKNGKTQEENINQAREIGCRLWEKGHAVICPHENTSYFEKDCNITYDMYIKGDLDMVSRCDCLVMTPDWETSNGAILEHDYAISLRIPIYIYPVVPELNPLENKFSTVIKILRENAMKEYRNNVENLKYMEMETI